MKEIYIEYKNVVSYFQVQSSVFRFSQWIHFATGFSIPADGKNHKLQVRVQASLGPVRKAGQKIKLFMKEFVFW